MALLPPFWWAPPYTWGAAPDRAECGLPAGLARNAPAAEGAFGVCSARCPRRRLRYVIPLL